MWRLVEKRLLPLLYLSAHAVTTHAVLTNRTIDDQKGDSVTGAVPVFLPPGGWNIGQACDTCTVNSAVIATEKVFDGTWHDSSHAGLTDSNKTIVVNFTGSAIYMYNILVNRVPATHTLTRLEFFLDGDHAFSFIHVPDNTTDVIYNALVYSNTSMPQGPHSLQAVASGNGTILTLFDYAIYTVDDGTQAPTQSTTTNSAAGCRFRNDSFEDPRRCHRRWCDRWDPSPCGPCCGYLPSTLPP
ncbi:hypothetical protein C8Q77DRAFT_865789 [Trametes polyzona]|nr:hypothetical protein C8Q77DRAFT_865789 [Trametes polyzona]